MRTNIVLFAIGVWLLQVQPALPDTRWAAAILLAAIAALACARAGGGYTRTAGKVVLKLVWLGAGFFWAAVSAQVRLADHLPSHWEGKDIEVIGVVAGLPQPYDRSVRFEFDIEHVLTRGASVPRRITLSWWGARADTAAPAPEVHPGERWRFVVRLRRPHGYSNPNGFDYEAWLLERGIRATGYVRSGAQGEQLAVMVYRPAYLVEYARDALRERIQRALPGQPYAGIVVALAVGDQRAIPPEQWQTFTRTGVNHLMSISGLHVTMIAGLAFSIVGALWRRSERLCLRMPASKAATAAGLAAAFAYTLLAGFAVPAQRTLYMLSVVAVALWLGIGGRASVVLATALLAVLLLDPWAVLAAGFWLSFGAVAIILYASVGRVGQPNWLVTWGRVQWAVTLAMIPMLLALFQQVSVVSPLTNALAIPVVSLVVAPLSLAGMLLPGDWVLVLAHQVMAWCMLALDWASELPAAVWQQHAPPAWSVIAALAGSAWLLMPRGFPARWAGLAGFLPLFLILPPPLAEGTLRLTVLDVGQGLAVVAETRDHTLLYDTGPPFGPVADSGNRIIVPFLRASGVKQLEGLIVSHDDADHTGGALSVIQALPVAWLLTSLPDMDPLQLHVEHAGRCFSGQTWNWDGVRFEVLHPAGKSYEDERIKDNDRSCVLKITAPGGSVLLPADIERRAEAALLAQAAARLRADVLVAPHQGSKTSSTPGFIEAVNPGVVVIPVGYRNRFGHPHAEVVERYRGAGAELFRTDRDGAIRILFEPGRRPVIERHRDLYRRYWHASPSPRDALPDEPAAMRP